MIKNYSGEMFLNVVTEREMAILELAQSIARIGGWTDEFTFDRNKPDGMPRKVMDVRRLGALSWTAPTDLLTDLREAYC